MSVDAVETASPTDRDRRTDWQRHLIHAGLISVARNCLTFIIPATLLWEYPLARASQDVRLFLLVFGTIIVVHVIQGVLTAWRLRVLRRAAHEFNEHHGGPLGSRP